jgi:hypothetical protein
VPNVPYAWQTVQEPILLPSIRGKSTSVFGLMKTCNKFFYEFFDKTINTDLLIDFFDRFLGNIVKKTVVVLDNSPLHTMFHSSKKFKAKIQEWAEQNLPCMIYGFILFHPIHQS